MPDTDETQVDEATDTTTEAPDPADEVILDGIEMPEGKEGAAEAQADEKPEEEAKTKDDPSKALEDRLAKLEKSYESASTHVKDLQKALHQTRQENKALKDGKGKDAEFLDDAAIKAILEEHGNDWATVVRVVNHMTERNQSKASAKVLDDVETKQVKANIDGFLQREWKEVLDPESPLRPAIEQAKQNLRIGDHPFADYLAAGAHLLQNFKVVSEQIAKQAAEKAKAEALGSKTEDARKKVVKDTKLTDKGTKPTTANALPPNVEKVARQMNMSPSQKKLYAKLVSGKRLAATVEA